MFYKHAFLVSYCFHTSNAYFYQIVDLIFFFLKISSVPDNLLKSQHKFFTLLEPPGTGKLRPRGYKTFSCSTPLRLKFILLIIDANSCCILTFMSKKNYK